MKYPMTLAAIVCTIGIPLSSQTLASQTDLSTVGKAVQNVNQLLEQTVNRNTTASGLKAPKITTSYLLGQGLMIAIAPINFTHKRDHKSIALGATANTPDVHNHDQKIDAVATSKQAEFRLEAKNLAHTALHLREQGKSLSKSISELKGDSESVLAEKAKLNQELEQVRIKQNQIEQQRQTHAQTTVALAQASNQVKDPQLAANAYRQQFYQALEQDVVQALCSKAAELSSIDDEEKVSIIYQQGGDQRNTGYSVKGWIVEKSLLSRCGKGEVDRQYLSKQATQYQY